MEDGVEHPRDCQCDVCALGPPHLRPHHHHKDETAEWVHTSEGWVVVDGEGRRHPQGCRCATCWGGPPNQSQRPHVPEPLRPSAHGSRRRGLIDENDHHSPHHRTSAPRRGILRDPHHHDQRPSHHQSPPPRSQTPYPRPEQYRPPTPAPAPAPFTPPSPPPAPAPPPTQPQISNVMHIATPAWAVSQLAVRSLQYHVKR